MAGRGKGDSETTVDTSQVDRRGQRTVMSVMRVRFKLWWLIALIGGFALLLGVFRSPLDNLALSLFMAPVGLFFLFSLYVLLVVFPYGWVLLLARCPACNRRPLRCSRLSLFRPPLASTHQCEPCGARWVRRFNGPFIPEPPPSD